MVFRVRRANRAHTEDAKFFVYFTDSFFEVDGIQYDSTQTGFNNLIFSLKADTYDEEHLVGEDGYIDDREEVVVASEGELGARWDGAHVWIAHVREWRGVEGGGMVMVNPDQDLLDAIKRAKQWFAQRLESTKELQNA